MKREISFWHRARVKRRACFVGAFLMIAALAARAELLVPIFNSNGRVFRYNEHTGPYLDTFVSTNNGGLNLPHG